MIGGIHAFVEKWRCVVGESEAEMYISPFLEITQRGMTELSSTRPRPVEVFS